MIVHVRCVVAAFSPHVVLSSLLGTSSGHPCSAQTHPKTSLLRPQWMSKWLKSYNNQCIFNIFRCPLFDVFGSSGRPKRISGSPLGRDREMYRAPWVPPGGPSGFRHLPQEGPKTPRGANLTSQSTPGATLSAPRAVSYTHLTLPTKA